MVPVKSLTGPTSDSVVARDSMPTTTWATSATTERPRQTARNRQRSLGTTEASQRGRIRCDTRITNQVTRIIEPSTRLR